MTFDIDKYAPNEDEEDDEDNLKYRPLIFAEVEHRRKKALFHH